MSSQLAILSPCSSCKNQREQEENGKPACPRRALLKMSKDLEADGRPLSTAFAPALLKGTEGTEQEQGDALRNPVYSDDRGHILVWVAHLQDNQGLYDEDGTAIVPPLVDSSFDTNEIRCHGRPYLVSENEAVYFQTGAYLEWDPLLVTELPGGQLDPVEKQGSEQLQIEGLARKVSLAYGFNRKPVPKDLSPRGT